MCRRVLPLNALRAFEAAARHNSLAKAAEELSVTPAAIHHQVKSLEDILGVPLLVRTGNTLTLTKAAADALPTLEGAFDLLSLAMERMRQHTSSGLLTLSVCPSFAQKWLVSRLHRFRQDFQGIELKISTAKEIPDLNNSEVDIAIGYGPEDRFRHPGVLSEQLLSDVVFPVCSPDYLDRRLVRGSLEGAATVLLHDANALRDQGVDWDVWRQRFAEDVLEAAVSITFDSVSLAIDAAIAGQGLALARSSLVANDLSSGRLIRVSKHELPTNSGYFINNLDLISDQPKVVAFKEWLFAEASIDKVQQRPQQLSVA